MDRSAAEEEDLLNLRTGGDTFETIVTTLRQRYGYTRNVPGSRKRYYDLRRSQGVPQRSSPSGRNPRGHGKRNPAAQVHNTGVQVNTIPTTSSRNNGPVNLVVIQPKLKLQFVSRGPSPLRSILMEVHSIHPGHSLLSSTNHHDDIEIAHSQSHLASHENVNTSQSTTQQSTTGSPTEGSQYS